MKADIEHDLEVVSNFINVREGNDKIKLAYRRVMDFVKEVTSVNMEPLKFPLLQKVFHYHYLVSYNFLEKTGNYGVGEMDITTLRKLSSKNVHGLKKGVFEKASGNNNKIINTVILSINPLECECNE